MIRKLVHTVLASVPVILISLTAGNSQDPPPAAARPQQKQVVEPSTQEQRKLIEDAKRFAAAVAPEDSPEYFRSLELNLFQLKLARFGPPPSTPGSLRIAAPDAKPMFSDVRQRVLEETANLASVYYDATWQKNYRKWIALPTEQQPLRVVGGVPALPGEFPDCVAVGSEGAFCCSGTLIGRNVVLTAAHCHAGGCASRIYIGNNSNQPGTGRVIKVKRDDNGELLALPHPDFNRFTDRNDVALLILEQNVEGVKPRAIASKAEIESAFYLKLVGFGYTNFALRDLGVKNKVDVVVASNSCDTQAAQERYGCNADVEIVAGGNGVDSCKGDSGGPAYVVIGTVVKLAGVSSRGTRNSSVPCGDGGNYARADRYIQEGDPLFQKAKAKGAIFE